MTGNEIAAIRAALRLDVSRFAQLLGVHPSTVWRWETAGPQAVRVEAMQLQVLAATQRQIAQNRPKDLGEIVLGGLVLGGGLLGLFNLLQAVFEPPASRRNGGAVARGKRPRARSSPTTRRRA